MFATPEFWSALAAIVVIDLVLAGDNAIVIALAARNLPTAAAEARHRLGHGRRHRWCAEPDDGGRRLAARRFPGCMVAGGVLLRLDRLSAARPRTTAGKAHDVGAGDGFWGAMRTIVVADAVMGLDNVLAVAGAAHGSYLLVVAGLVISVPIVVWGSTVVLKLVERFPACVYVGAGVLVWTAVKMIGGEPLLQELLDARSGLRTSLFVVIIGGVLGLAWLRNRKAAAARQDARKEAVQ